MDPSYGTPSYPASGVRLHFLMCVPPVELYDRYYCSIALYCLHCRHDSWRHEARYFSNTNFANISTETVKSYGKVCSGMQIKPRTELKAENRTYAQQPSADVPWTTPQGGRSSGTSMSLVTFSMHPFRLPGSIGFGAVKAGPEISIHHGLRGSCCGAGLNVHQQFGALAGVLVSDPAAFERCEYDEHLSPCHYRIHRVQGRRVRLLG